MWLEPGSLLAPNCSSPLTRTLGGSKRLSQQSSRSHGGHMGRDPVNGHVGRDLADEHVGLDPADASLRFPNKYE